MRRFKIINDGYSEHYRAYQHYGKQMHCLCWYILPASLIAQLVKNLPAVQETFLHSWVGKIPWRRQRLPTPVFSISEEFKCISCGSNTFPCGSAGKESACNVGDLGSIPGSERSPGEGKGYPLQYPGLENSMNCIVHWVTKSQLLLSVQFTSLHADIVLYQTVPKQW